MIRVRRNRCHMHIRPPGRTAYRRPAWRRCYAAALSASSAPRDVDGQQWSPPRRLIRRLIRRPRECAWSWSTPHPARAPPPGHREERKYRMVAAHVAALGCQITQMRASQFEREPAAGLLGGCRDHAVSRRLRSRSCPARGVRPFLMGLYVQRQIGFRGNRDLHRSAAAGRCRFRGCGMTADWRCAGRLANAAPDPVSLTVHCPLLWRS